MSLMSQTLFNFNKNSKYYYRNAAFRKYFELYAQIDKLSESFISLCFKNLTSPKTAFLSKFSGRVLQKGISFLHKGIPFLQKVIPFLQKVIPFLQKGIPFLQNRISVHQYRVPVHQNLIPVHQNRVRVLQNRV